MYVSLGIWDGIVNTIYVYVYRIFFVICTHHLNIQRFIKETTSVEFKNIYSRDQIKHKENIG